MSRSNSSTNSRASWVRSTLVASILLRWPATAMYWTMPPNTIMRTAVTTRSSTREKPRAKARRLYSWVREILFSSTVISLSLSTRLNHRAQRYRPGIEDGSIPPPACVRNDGCPLPRGDGQQTEPAAGVGTDFHNVPANLVNVAAARLVLHGVTRSGRSGHRRRRLGPVNIADLGGSRGRGRRGVRHCSGSPRGRPLAQRCLVLVRVAAVESTVVNVDDPRLRILLEGGEFFDDFLIENCGRGVGLVS